VRRWRVYRRFQLDDLFSAAAAFLVIPYTAATLVDDKVQYEMEEYALGLSASPPSLERIQNAFKTEVAATVFMWLIIYAAKAAFLTIYWRASCGRRAARHAWFAAAGVTSLCFGIIFFSVFWVCGSPTRVGDLGRALIRPEIPRPT
jgi:glycerol uptake facilitator-like aquaporin